MTQHDILSGIIVVVAALGSAFKWLVAMGQKIAEVTNMFDGLLQPMRLLLILAVALVVFGRK